MTEKRIGRIRKYVEAIKGAQFATGFVLGVFLMFFAGKSLLSWSTAAPPINFQPLEVVSMQGDTLAFSEVASGYRLVYFWASWHKRSSKDLPRLYTACKELKAAGCGCIALSDENPKIIQGYYSSYQQHIAFFRSPKAFFEIGLKGLPSFYLLNAKGEILLSKTGSGHWDKPASIQKIKDLLQ